ncbi:cytochrome c553 [Thiohalobacter thiocyanaticus]|uniref:Cytochrome c553 n=1 Tax=Thiohalobacter thiocyanaticus TaxID=585455 RepID=A0A1Z4VQ18_9GAMM|nr:cytochrome c553 [Thiohalobacter thiocyanaticus]
MGNADAGKRIVMQGNDQGTTACVSCHGADGEGNPAAGFPRLAGLSDKYLSKQLRDYRQGTRSNPVMQPIAAALEQQQLLDVAAYYAGQVPTNTADDAAPPDGGRKLALRGDWDNTIPACVSCHGPGGHGVDPYFPALAGQHASYIQSQLEAWRKGSRHNDTNDLMRVVAERLSQTQIQAVSEYFAAQPAVKPAPGAEQ